jgi:alpha-N-arabinofuranosidase
MERTENAGNQPTTTVNNNPNGKSQLNPIISGFYPDPSICRVGEDYYLATSSFEYFPGVPIFHSRDLVHWRQIGHALNRESQLPLTGAKCSDAIGAPTLRYHDGRFHMVTFNGAHGGNFHVSAENPAGEWSEPVWLQQRGIDPSLHFDESGKVFLTTNGTMWNSVRGLYQCEIDIRSGKQLTDSVFVWPGSGGSYPEAPHLFKRGEYYYMIAAEGGTAECHMVTIARSTNPNGPFESCPHNPILSHRSLMTFIHATGHADFVEDQRGNWWAVFLGIRYASGFFHNLGRETFLAPVRWRDDGWPVVNEGRPVQLEMARENLLPPYPWPAEPVRDDFKEDRLRLPWVFLRNPNPCDWSLSERPGFLRLRCSPVTLDELASPAFIGRRQQHFECRASALIHFQPQTEDEEAGMTALISNDHHCEIAVTLRSDGRAVVVRRRIGDLVKEVACEPLPDGPAVISIETDREFYYFNLQQPDGSFRALATSPLRYLSTEVAGGFTGVMLGLFASSHGTQSRNQAWFDWFDYEPTTSARNLK